MMAVTAVTPLITFDVSFPCYLMVPLEETLRKDRYSLLMKRIG